MEAQQFEMTSDIGCSRIGLSGVLRLPSQEAYEGLIGSQNASLLDTKSLEIDLARVAFMNSSGIRWLGSLVLAAKERQIPIVVKADRGVLWQRKSLENLQLLYDGLTIEF